MKLFVNDLTVMDFSYLCPKRGVVGESWIVDVVLDGGLNDESMVQDFGIVKKQLKGIIDDYVDHKLVIPAEHSATTIYEAQADGRIQVDFEYSKEGKVLPIQLLCPPEAYAFVYGTKEQGTEISMASVNAYLKDVIATHLPENVHDIEIILRTEQIDTPFYHYTHGLKKHDGNCQRIAHGHRSKILIFEDNEPSLKWQKYWADRWCDIYIGSEEDLVNQQQLNFSLCSDEPVYCFQYEASQGVFEMAIAQQACEVIALDSTVECLAQYVLEYCAANSNSPIRVHAFEGVGKGAIVSSI